MFTIRLVRLLYDRAQTTARIVARSKDDLEIPLASLATTLTSMRSLKVGFPEYDPLLYTRNEPYPPPMYAIYRDAQLEI